jgi:predicted ribosome quality control (RQC) complex YloA/Tae2 family protein
MAIGLDSFGVTFLARELRDLLVGYSVGSVCLKDNKILIFYMEGRRPLNLVFLVQPNLPLICASERLGRGEELPHPPRLEQPLRDCTITDISQIELDRILLFSLKSTRDRLLRLYFELVPPFPNMFLAEGDDTILEPLFKAGTRTRRRVLGRGETYSPPPPPEKIHPADVTPRTLEALHWKEDPEVLSKVVIGVSPFLSREITARASAGTSLYQAFSGTLADYRQERSAPCIFRVSHTISKTPPHRGIAWFRPRAQGVLEVRAKPSLNEAVEVLASEFLAVSKLESLRSAILKILARQIRKQAKVVERAVGARKARDNADRFSKLGEILVANMGKVRKGASQVTLPDIYSQDGREVVIPLDPKLTPQANAQAYFKRARRSLRRAEGSAERLEKGQTRLEAIRKLEEEARSPGTPESRMTEILATLRQEATTKEEERPAEDERAKRLGIRPRRYVVAGGWTVLVGRSARENDILTHRYASPDDLWFHARQAQGSHVVLRRQAKRSQVPREAIIQAASLAAYYSKARTSKTASVSYTERRYVKKVRKGPPGTAVMLREKVIFVVPALPVDPHVSRRR